MIYTPNQHGLKQLINIPLDEIVPFIHWTFFFKAWKLSGKYDGIETVCDCTSCGTSWLQRFSTNEKEEAQEAVKLFKDAQEMLRTFRDESIISVNAAVGIYPANAEGDDIVIHDSDKTIRLATLRQQAPSRDGYCYALADFVHPKEDYIGVFATTIAGGEEYAAIFEKDEDIYTSMLIKTIADRLAEATAEWLHWKVRTDYWGYVPNESMPVEEMFKVHYQGIRPAVGYPSLPDQSVIFDIDPLIRFSEIGITLTENGAMYPNASVCGLYFAHPRSFYFGIGKIDEQQVTDYEQRRGKQPGELRKWLAANL